MLQRTKLFEFVGFCLTAWASAGCGSPDWARSMNDSFTFKETSSKEVEEKHRQEYAASHSRKAMRWLLGYRVDTGMSYEQVCNILGEAGTPESYDRAFKLHGGNYFLVGDEIYSWKDNEGRAVYLGFREGRLVNFERSEFR